MKTMPTLSPKELSKEKPTEAKSPTDMEQDLQVSTDIDTKTMTPEEAMKIPAIAEMTKIAGVGPTMALRLFNGGYTLDEISTGRADEIAQTFHVTFAVAKGWVMAAQELRLSGMKLMKIGELTAEKKSKQFFFKTGSLLLNGILGGGAATWAITGLCGPLATGKTAITEDMIVDALNVNNYTCPKCYTKLQSSMAKCTAKEKDGKLCDMGGKSAVQVQVAWIETEPDTIHQERLEQIALKRGIKCNFDNLYVCPANQVPTMKAQFLQYKLIQKELEHGANIHLVVVDSFNAKLRAGWSRTEMLPIRSRELAEHFNLIEFLACRYNIAWVLTCQVMEPPRAEMQGMNIAKFGDRYGPIGGDMLLHSVNQWVSVDRCGGQYKATLFDSSYLPKREIMFKLDIAGIKDGDAQVPKGVP